MAGEIKLNSVNFASELGGTITVNNGTLSSSVVFPTSGLTTTSSDDSNTSPSTSSAAGASTTSNNRTVSANSSDIEHLKTAHFTTNGPGDIICWLVFAHGFEEGTVFTTAKFILESVSGSSPFTYSDVSNTYGEATARSQESYKQGTQNLAQGNHSNFYIFRDVPAGKYQVKVAVSVTGGTYVRYNYFGGIDRLTVFYRGS